MSFTDLCRRAPQYLAAVLSVILLSCAASTEFYRDIDERITAGEYTNALEYVKQNRDVYGDKTAVLYNLDLGLLYHYAGEYDSSINYLFAAEREIEDLYTKSISQQALSFVLSDNILPYEGEDFEKVLINVFLALNYAKKRMTDDALVEARKVDLKLREYARQYDDKNTYKEDAFIRYIAGALYESGGEINDAFISYRKAHEAYTQYVMAYGTRAPDFLLDDLVRTATMLSFTNEAAQYASLGGMPFDGMLKKQGSILVIVYSGRAPIKVEERPTVSVADSSGTLHTFQIALPKFVPRHRDARSYNITVISEDDSLSAVADLMEDVTAIAEKTLDDRLTLLYLKSGGRAVLKFLAAEKIKSEMNKDDGSAVKNFLGSLAIDIVVGATEQADVRCWRTLPAEIHLARLNVPPGIFTVNTTQEGAGWMQTDTVNVRPGEVSFVIVNDVR